MANFSLFQVDYESLDRLANAIQTNSSLLSTIEKPIIELIEELYLKKGDGEVEIIFDFNDRVIADVLKTSRVTEIDPTTETLTEKLNSCKLFSKYLVVSISNNLGINEYILEDSSRPDDPSAERRFTSFDMMIKHLADLVCDEEFKQSEKIMGALVMILAKSMRYKIEERKISLEEFKNRVESVWKEQSPTGKRKSPSQSSAAGTTKRKKSDFEIVNDLVPYGRMEIDNVSETNPLESSLMSLKRHMEVVDSRPSPEEELKMEFILQLNRVWRKFIDINTELDITLKWEDIFRGPTLEESKFGQWLREYEGIYRAKEKK